MAAPHGPATPRWLGTFAPCPCPPANIERNRVAMNDPHVVALEYRSKHEPDVIDWFRAAPLDKEEHRFRVQAGSGRVQFELKEHFASEEAAQFAVGDAYIRN